MEAGSLGPAMELATRHAFQVMCGHACNNHASARTVAALRLSPIGRRSVQVTESEGSTPVWQAAISRPQRVRLAALLVSRETN